MDDWTEDDVFERFGKPRTGKLVGRPRSGADGSTPRYVVEPADMPDAKYLKHEILLSDFGEAFPFGQPPKPKDIGIPFMYRAPETMFDSKLDPSSEVWSLACILFEIRAGNPLFTNIMGGRDEILQQMVQMKGKLPDQWWVCWEKRSMCFDEEGKPLKKWEDGLPLAIEYPLDMMIAEIGGEDDEEAFFGSELPMLEPKDTRVPAGEAESMRDLLAGMLRWSPEERPSVAQVAQHPWVRGEETRDV